VAKYNIDDILSDLGVPSDKDGAPKTVKRPQKDAPPPRRHRIDNEEDSFSPLPPMPANQKKFGQEETSRTPDPAVKRAPTAAPQSAVGRRSTTSTSPTRRGDSLGAHRGPAGAAEHHHPAQLTQAQNVVKQTPGKLLTDVLIEQGWKRSRFCRWWPSLRTCLSSGST